MSRPLPMSRPSPHDLPAPAQRLLFLDALRAFASLTILWHHFALYPPLREWAAPLAGGILDWFEHHARATQVFFVVGGYVMARTMHDRRWDFRGAGGFVVLRYCRLGIPYLAVIALVIPVCAFGRGWLPDPVVGGVPTLPQLLAHVFFLQDVLGYEQLSAGLWFVCINFQLGLIYLAGLLLRDLLPKTGIRRIPDASLAIGWVLSALGLFHFNLNPGWDRWALYFYPYFFMGIVVHRGLKDRAGQIGFWCFMAMLVAAMAYDWRWRLLSALVVGGLLFVAEKTGFGGRWPRTRWVLMLGRVSYSLFLIHFPVLVLVASVWSRMGWTSPWAGVAGLLAAFGLSVAAAMAFFRWIEAPAGRLVKRLRKSRYG